LLDALAGIVWVNDEQVDEGSWRKVTQRSEFHKVGPVDHLPDRSMSPCIHIPLPGGGAAIVRVAEQRRRKCEFCNNTHTLLCDYVIGRWIWGEEITCDARICASCARHTGEDNDLCPRHQ
jgi:hypothetical protein